MVLSAGGACVDSVPRPRVNRHGPTTTKATQADTTCACSVVWSIKPTSADLKGVCKMMVKVSSDCFTYSSPRVPWMVGKHMRGMLETMVSCLNALGGLVVAKVLAAGTSDHPIPIPIFGSQLDFTKRHT